MILFLYFKRSNTCPLWTSVFESQKISFAKIFYESFEKWLIVINEIRQISRKKLDFAKLTETRSEIS